MGHGAMPYNTIEKRRAYDLAHPRTERAKAQRSTASQKREQVRQQERHVKEWSYSTMWLMTADGEADNEARYDQFSIYCGDPTCGQGGFHDLGQAGKIITFGAFTAYLRRVTNLHRRKDNTRRANVIHMFSYHYDLDKLIGNEPLFSEEEKMLIASQRSNSYGVQRTVGWEREIVFPQLKIALYVGRKETVIRYLKTANGRLLQTADGQYVTGYTLYLHDTYTLTAQSFVKTIQPLEKVLT